MCSTNVYGKVPSPVGGNALGSRCSPKRENRWRLTWPLSEEVGQLTLRCVFWASGWLAHVTHVIIQWSWASASGTCSTSSDGRSLTRRWYVWTWDEHSVCTWADAVAVRQRMLRWSWGLRLWNVALVTHRVSHSVHEGADHYRLRKR